MVFTCSGTVVELVVDGVVEVGASVVVVLVVVEDVVFVMDLPGAAQAGPVGLLPGDGEALLFGLDEALALPE